MNKKRRGKAPELRESKRGPKPVKVGVVLLSTGTLTPEEALAWLRDDARGYFALVQDAVNMLPGCGAFRILDDLADMVEGIAQAALRGASLQVERTHGDDPGDEPRQLAELLTTGDITDTGFPCRDRAVRALGRELVGRLGTHRQGDAASAGRTS